VDRWSFATTWRYAQSDPVAAIAAKSLTTTATPAQLLEHVKVDVPANSQILRIKYRATRCR
jgi:capsular polysaccharide biosynthesis protein